MDSESVESASQPPDKALDIDPPSKAPHLETPAKATIIEPSDGASDIDPPAKSINAELPAKANDVEPPSKSSDTASVPPTMKEQENSSRITPSVLSPSDVSPRDKSMKVSQAHEDSQTGVGGMSTFARFTSGLGLRLPSVASAPDESVEGASSTMQTGSVLESFTKGLVDSSRSAVKAMQVKARHIVSQNKRRFQEDGYDLDMTYITENIIAMGFPAGDISSGIFVYFEGIYRNRMEEVIKFFETHHKGKYKVYNLCSERLYDASLFEGKVACFPFDDHNCPPIQLLSSFCQSAYSWLKEDIENVVVVHCKAGMGRTGLMICSLLLYLKFFSTAEESIDYYNQKRCVDGKALVLPSQIRYVNYFEHIITNFGGDSLPGRRCMLRGFRLLKCPYWIRPSITISNHSGILFSTKNHPKTKNLMPEDFWISSPKKGIVVFALPGEPGLTELVGDFKIHFQDRQGDFYCWLNTTMTENRKTLNSTDFDGFDKRNLPSPGFQVEVVMIDYDGTLPTKSTANATTKGSDGTSGSVSVSNGGVANNVSGAEDNDDVFSDSEGEDTVNSKSKQARAGCKVGSDTRVSGTESGTLIHGTESLSVGGKEPTTDNASKDLTTNKVGKSTSSVIIPNMGASDIKAIAADASVFTFGDDEDYESE
ncbi:PTEN_C2 domain-containing protein [Cephalotus follicularis]|uniref:PTEN_C2 domain-containing protein n=1 Tax=Cephalotus follicularis TaxID=3775 RepID=A0A1Q3B7L7_CEPFO|nr:PTEN_C2 domain-containing protein [Cephalotus follicularis]